MKKTLLVFIAAAAMVTACKKDNDREQTTQEKIVGTWKVSKYTSTEFFGTLSSSTYTGVAGDVFEFKSDGTLYATYDGYSDTAVYKLRSDSSITFLNPVYGDSMVFKITSLASSNLNLYSKSQYSGGNYSEDIFELKR